MQPLELRDDRGHVRATGVRGKQTEMQRPLERLACVVYLSQRVQQRVVGRIHLYQQASPQRRQRAMTACSTQQLPAQLGFEAAECLAHPGRCQMQSLGGTAEMTLLGEGEKYPDLTQLDGVPHCDDYLPVPVGVPSTARQKKA